MKISLKYIPTLALSLALAAVIGLGLTVKPSASQAASAVSAAPVVFLAEGQETHGYKPREA